MKYWLIICSLLFSSLTACPQSEDLTPLASMGWDMLLPDEGSVQDDEGDAWSKALEIKKKIDINLADPVWLGDMLGLTELQVRSFDMYRRQLGPFIDILELQSVPGWDPLTVRRIIPYVKISPAGPGLAEALKSTRYGEHVFLARLGITKNDIYNAKASAPTAHAFLGRSHHVLYRYAYRYHPALQWNLTLEKDAGERFLQSSIRPDFVSGGLTIRGKRAFRMVRLGDYQVNLGQGLIHWQGMAFRKTSDALMVKRQSDAIRPYQGTDENRFHRGLAFAMQKSGWEMMAFFSFRHLDANLVNDSTMPDGNYVSSLLTTGLHRSLHEIEDMDALKQLAWGGHLHYQKSAYRIGINGIGYSFGLPIRKDPLPYNLYSIKGRDWQNLSIDAGLSYRNMHCFGELARDRMGNYAIVQGFMAALHPFIDMSLVYRNIPSAYRAIHGNAFTEQSEPQNERGVYVGLCIRLPRGWKVNGWMDVFHFPWLRYQVHRPSEGMAASFHATWNPNKKTEFQLRWHQHVKEQNVNPALENIYSIQPVKRSGLRMQFTHHFSPVWMLRSRIETSRSQSYTADEQGFLYHIDIHCKPRDMHWRLAGRLTLFETSGYASRMYGFENDVPYRNAMSVYDGKGLRAYMVVGWKSQQHWQVSAKLGMDISQDNPTAGSFDARIQLLLSIRNEGLPDAGLP